MDDVDKMRNPQTKQPVGQVQTATSSGHIAGQSFPLVCVCICHGSFYTVTAECCLGLGLGFRVRVRVSFIGSFIGLAGLEFPCGLRKG